MKLNIGGQFVAEYANGMEVTPVISNTVLGEKGTGIGEKVSDIYKQYIMPSAVALGTLSISTNILAATGAIANDISIAERLFPLITMIQELALPVGIAIASWGLVEIIVGNFPSGKNKVKYALIGFAGMFIIPEVFYAIRGAFQ